MMSKEKTYKETKNHEEAHKDYDFEGRAYASIFPKTLIGAKIVDLRYGPDQDGDAVLYYFELDNGIKIGICRVIEKDGECITEEEDRTKTFEDGSFLRFQFHDWPEDWKELVKAYRDKDSNKREKPKGGT